jgi:hypothetical protein
LYLVSSAPSSAACRASQRVEVGLGKKMAEGLQFGSQAVAGFVLALTYEPLFTLVLIATTPILALCGSFLNRVTTSGAARIETSYSRVRGLHLPPSTLHPPIRASFSRGWACDGRCRGRGSRRKTRHIRSFG